MILFLLGPGTWQHIGTFDIRGDGFVSLGGVAQKIVGTTATTCSTAETTMSGMTQTFTPKSRKIKISFNAPITCGGSVSRAPVTLKIRINKGGLNYDVRTAYHQVYGTEILSISTIESVTANETITASILWSGTTSISSQPSLYGNRVMEIQDLY